MNDRASMEGRILGMDRLEEFHDPSKFQNEFLRRCHNFIRKKWCRQKLHFASKIRNEELNVRNKLSITFPKAIVIGLGGVARDTSRVDKMSEFINYDSNKAEVKIALYNGGDNAFRQDVYGDRIIFERILRRVGERGSTEFHIKNSRIEDVYRGPDAFKEQNRYLDDFIIVFCSFFNAVDAAIAINPNFVKRSC